MSELRLTVARWVDRIALVVTGSQDIVAQTPARQPQLEPSSDQSVHLHDVNMPSVKIGARSSASSSAAIATSSGKPAAINSRPEAQPRQNG